MWFSLAGHPKVRFYVYMVEDPYNRRVLDWRFQVIEARVLGRLLTRTLKLSIMLGGGSGARQSKGEDVSLPSRNMVRGSVTSS